MTSTGSTVGTDPTRATTDGAGVVTTATGPRPEAAGQQERAGVVTWQRVLRSELIKLRSMRSTVYALVVAVLCILIMGIVTAIGVIVQKVPADGFADAPVDDPAGGSLAGVSLALYAVMTLGVVVVTSEYASGTIKSSLAAVPRRSLLVVGKILALAVVVLPVTVASTLVSFFAARAVLATADRSISLTTPGVLRAVVGAGLYLTVVAVIAAGFGWLLRSTAGAVAAVLGVLVVVPTFAQLLPRSIAEKVLPYLPDSAGTAILQTSSEGRLGPWTGFAVFCGYALVTITAAVLVLRRRDA